MSEREKYRPKHAARTDAGDEPTHVGTGWDADEGEGDVEPFAGDDERAPSGPDER